MPTFARAKFVLHDDCFNTSIPILKVNYAGPNPQLAYTKIREMFTTIIGVNVMDRVQETDYSWDRKEGSESFKVGWEIVKEMDKFTYIVIRIGMKGFAETKDGSKDGKVSIELNGFMRTEYPQDTVWERSIFYEMLRVFWHKVFYREKRYDYQEHCRELLSKMSHELKSFFNLIPKRL
jgi:hypothetical protein